jgi:CHAT domain-containing protein
MDVSKILDCNSVEEQDLVSQYVGRKLSPEEAEAFEEHYFGCDRCWAEVQRATELRAALQKSASDAKEMAPEPVPPRVIRGPWRNWGLLAAAAAVAFVAVAAVLLVSKGASRSRDPGTLVADLAEAVGQRHSIRARLTGGFRYPEVSRSAGAPEKAPSWKVFAEAEKIKQAAERNVTAETARALGLAHLFVGETDQAVARLEEGALLAPKDARIHSDLSAAYLILAEQKDRPDAFVRALSEAETAIQIQPDLAEAHFNKALALEAMSLKDKAKQAWEDYLRLDSKSEWAGEARRHLEALSVPRASRAWEEEQKRLHTAIERGDSAVVQEVVRHFPQQSREHFEQQLLPEWAEASAGRPRSESTRLLRSLELFAREHSRATGDRMLADVTKATFRVLESSDSEALPRLTRGLTHYSRGKGLLDRLESQKAQIELDQARMDLSQSANPLSGWADFYRAICLYYKDDFEGSRVECEPVRELASKRHYGNLLGRAFWMTGLIHVVHGEVDPAVRDFSSALSCFTATGESSHAAAVHSLLAGAYGYLGETRVSWSHRLAGLRLLGDPEDPRRAHRLYSDAAVAAMSHDLPLAGLVFQEAAIATAASWDSPLVFTEAHLYRSFILRKVDRREEAAAELLKARRWLAAVQDPGLKQGELAEVSAALGEMDIATRPREAQELLGSALRYFRDTGQRLRLAEIYLARGRAFLKSGDANRAESDFTLGIAEFERELLVQAGFRVSFFERSWTLFEELLRLEAIVRRRPETALVFAERQRARDLLSRVSSAAPSASDAADPNGVPLEPSSIRLQLPRSTSLLYFASLSDRLLSWMVSAEGIHFAQRAIGADELARRVAVHRKILERAGTPQELSSSASSLYDDLLRPHAGSLRSSTTLVVLPDGPLHDLPFSTLLDRGTGRYVVQDHAVAVAPSATLFLRASQRADAPSADGGLSALVVGNPEFDRNDSPHLPSLPGATEEAKSIAALYPGSELLLGSNATPRRFLEAAPRHDIVHFSGHALADAEYPGLSRLVLAPESAADSGSLFARDIYGRRFPRLRLVILAACRSAEGVTRRGEGSMNLARPFLAAGVPSVIGALWDIDDRTSGAFFLRYHRTLREGFSPLEALREVQLACLADRDPALRSPAAWGPFVFFGSDGSKKKEDHTHGYSQSRVHWTLRVPLRQRQG